VVAAEDTRNTGTLLQRYGLHKKLLAAHQHNELDSAQKIVALLQSGARVALVSDAGTPAISDPGAQIVTAVQAAGLRVMPIAGASAVTTALSAAGLTQGEFCFVGFLSTKAMQRRAQIQTYAALPFNWVVYEAPHRIAATLADLHQVLGDAHEVVIARELTKQFETIVRLRLEASAAWIAADKHNSTGEFVLIVPAVAVAAEAGLNSSAKRCIELLMAEVPLSSAVRLAQQLTSAPKSALYDYALSLQDKK
jgi:16S rRNA (cytidine1402-2'-O)-methyltransferase